MVPYHYGRRWYPIVVVVNVQIRRKIRHENGGALKKDLVTVVRGGPPTNEERERERHVC